MRSHKRPWLERVARSAIPTFLLAGLALMLGAGYAAADTFTVTSTQCTGAGSITEAMDMANTSPGEDIIAFPPGLTVNAGTCPTETICATPDVVGDCFFLQATESVTFDGQGALIEGQINYISPDGFPIEGQDCPDPDNGDLILSETPGFIKVGIDEQSNAGITVTIRDLHLAELGAVATIEQDASLVIEDSSIERIYAPFKTSCDMRAVRAYEGASFTARGTEWNFIWNDADSFFGFVFPGAIAGGDAADLTIENSEFNQASTAGLISWLAPAGRTVNIVSSRFSDTGGIVVQGGATTNLVNSIWATGDGGTNTEDRIVNDSTGEMNLIASTLLFASPNCDDACQDLDESRGLVHRRPNAGTINLIQSAIGISFPDDIGSSGYKEVLDPDTSDPSPPAFGFSADLTTWIQPTGVNTPGQGGQDAATLQTVTNQPGLLTAAPGLRTSPDIGVGPTARAEPLVPGELIDRIANSACGQANQLINPMDGSCITEDALGNPRVDGNNSRNIGAVQLQEAPHLSVAAVGSGTVDLSWTKPKDLTGDFTGYVLFYRISGSGDVATQVPIDGPDTLTYQVTGLTNGTEYEFLIDSFVDGAIGGVASNLVTATPYGEIGTPALTVTSTSCGSALVEWTQPDLGGRTFEGYTVSWRLEGSDTLAGAIDIQDYDTLSTEIAGLNCFAKYTFAVSARSVDGASGSQGTDTVLILPAPVPPVPPAPKPVPALDQLGLLLLTLLTLGVGVAGMRRYRRNPFDVG